MTRRDLRKMGSIRMVGLKGILLLKEPSWRGSCSWVLLGGLRLLGTFIRIRLMPSWRSFPGLLKVNFDREWNPAGDCWDFYVILAVRSWDLVFYLILVSFSDLCWFGRSLVGLECWMGSYFLFNYTEHQMFGKMLLTYTDEFLLVYVIRGQCWKCRSAFAFPVLRFELQMAEPKTSCGCWFSFFWIVTKFHCS